MLTFSSILTNEGTKAFLNSEWMEWIATIVDEALETDAYTL